MIKKSKNTSNSKKKKGGTFDYNLFMSIPMSVRRTIISPPYENRSLMNNDFWSITCGFQYSSFAKCCRKSVKTTTSISNGSSPAVHSYGYQKLFCLSGMKSSKY